MKVGVFATFMSPNATPQMIRDFGQRAEGMGLDSVWMGEHVVLFDKQTFGYPGLQGRPHPGAAGRRHARRHRDLRLPRRRDQDAALRHRRGAGAAAQPDLHAKEMARSTG
jgi:hypothetical protein